MKKLILILAALAAPLQAQTVPITVDSGRYEEIYRIAPSICRTALRSGGDMGENVKMLTRGYTIQEQLLVMAVCNGYLHGLKDGISSI
jgi:hypothetical protein